MTNMISANRGWELWLMVTTLLLASGCTPMRPPASSFEDARDNQDWYKNSLYVNMPYSKSTSALRTWIEKCHRPDGKQKAAIPLLTDTGAGFAIADERHDYLRVEERGVGTKGGLPGFMATGLHAYIELVPDGDGTALSVAFRGSNMGARNIAKRFRTYILDGGQTSCLR